MLSKALVLCYSVYVDIGLVIWRNKREELLKDKEASRKREEELLAIIKQQTLLLPAPDKEKKDF